MTCHVDIEQAIRDGIAAASNRVLRRTLTTATRVSTMSARAGLSRLTNDRIIGAATEALVFGRA